MSDLRPNGNCKSCGMPVRWAVMESKDGRATPLDPKPRPDGNLRVIGWHKRGNRLPTPIVTVSIVTEPVVPERYVTHFASCPNASEHRRR